MPRLSAWWCLPAVVLVALVYLWFISSGTWTTWPERSRYYDDLALAFRAGHLYLDIQPPAELLALHNPYQPGARNSVPGLKAALEPVTDLSFYGGKFYVYWGPAPALLLAALKIVLFAPVPDQVVAFAFILGLFIFLTLMILALWREYYPEAPLLLVVTSIVVAGLACPLPWMLANAGIYEATIAGGQFFLIGGLYFASLAIRSQPASRIGLFLASVFWPLAAASRTLMLIPAAFLILMLVLWVALEGGERTPTRRSLARASIFAIPFAITLAALGWYNWARFGSLIETGLRYTLTFRDLNRFSAESFSASYFLPSLWTFLVHPFQVISGFPFISATYGNAPALLYIGDASMYHAEAITGLFFGVPFVVFSIVALVKLVRSLPRNQSGVVPETDLARARRLRWLSLALTGSALLPFAAVLLYFNVAMRFIVEFLPSLMLLAVLGLWQGDETLRTAGSGRLFYRVFAVLLGALTIVISLLLTLTEFQTRLQQYSPQFMHQLGLIFGR